MKSRSPIDSPTTGKPRDLTAEVSKLRHIPDAQSGTEVTIRVPGSVSRYSGRVKPGDRLSMCSNCRVPETTAKTQRLAVGRAVQPAAWVRLPSPEKYRMRPRRDRSVKNSPLLTYASIGTINYSDRASQLWTVRYRRAECAILQRL